MRVGTRKSPLAQAQTDRVLARLPPGVAQKILIETEGDKDATSPLHKLERPGAFTSLLTDAVLDGRIDAAIHSLKDLPLHAPDDAPIVAILPRDDPADALLIRDTARDDTRPLGLRAGSRVGTSAPRRQSQILAADAELIPIDVRGNVGTRLKLIEAGILDAVLIANAAFERLDITLPDRVTRTRLDPTEFPTGPGQGAIAVQARRGSEAASALARLDDATTRRSVDLERALLGLLGGGCGLPLGAYAAQHADGWSLHATFTDEAWATRTPLRLRRAHVVGLDLHTLLRDAKSQLDASTAPEAPIGTNPALLKRLVLTLPAEACEAYAPTLARAGWAIVPWELIHDAPTHAPLPPGADTAAWIAITSPRAAPNARHALDRHTGPTPRVAALGPATARALRRLDVPVHLVASGSTGASLADEIARFPAKPSSVLLPQASHALPDLAHGLLQHRFTTIPWPVYEMRANPDAPSLPTCDALLLTSPSNAEAMLKQGPPPNVPLLAFGPTTEAAMQRLGLPVAGTCAGRNPSDILQVLS